MDSRHFYNNNRTRRAIEPCSCQRDTTAQMYRFMT